MRRPSLDERLFETDWGTLRVRYRGITAGEKISALEALEPDVTALRSWQGIMSGLRAGVDLVSLDGEKIATEDIPEGWEVEVMLAHPAFRRGQSESE